MSHYEPRTPATYEPPELRLIEIPTPAPVQNTWYILLEEALVDIYDIILFVQIDGEDLELEILADGQPLQTIPLTAGANIPYRLFWNAGIGGNSFMFDIPGLDKSKFFSAREIRMRYRKTSNNGAGNLTGRVRYGQY